MDKYHDVDILCNARIDSVMYDLSSECTGKRDLPKKYGERLSPEHFDFETTETGDWKIGVRSMLTRLCGGRVIYAFVTLPKSGNGSRRTLYEKAESILLDYSNCKDGTIRGYQLNL